MPTVARVVNWCVVACLVATTSQLGSTEAQIVSPESSRRAGPRCGAEIKKKDVLVLDLERFGDDSEAATEFIERYVENLQLKSEAPETIGTTLRSARKNRMSAMKRAQRTAAERGCNVVIVLRAWAGRDEATYVQTIPTPSGGAQGFGVGLHHAYATVLMGTGDH